MNLKTRTNVAFLLALLTLGMIAWFAIRVNRSAAEEDNLVSHNRDVLEACETLRADLFDAAAARRVYTTLRDPTQVKNFDAAKKAALTEFGKLRVLTVSNSAEQSSLTEMEPLISLRLALLAESIAAHQSSRADEAEQKGFDDRNAKVSSQLTEVLDAFDRAERTALQQRSTAAEAGDRRSEKINAVLAASVLLFLMLSLAVLNRELSRREQAEHSAAEQRGLLQTILDSCQDAVIVADASGKIILRNPVGVRYNAGAPVQELSDEYPRALGLYKGNGQTLFKAGELPLGRALSDGASSEVEICVRPDGVRQPKWMLAAGGPLINEAREKKGAVVFLRDITDRKNADEQLKVALLESEALSKESKELSELGDALQSCLTAAEAYKMCEAALPRFLGDRPGALCLLNPSRDLVESIAVWGDCSTTEAFFHPDACWALRRGKGYGGAGSLLPCAHVKTSFGTNYLCEPLTAQGEVLGLLYVEDRQSSQSSLPQSPSPGVEEFERVSLLRRANAVAERVSLALSNLRLRELLRNQSIRDPLTGLYNRRYLEESLNRELHRASRAGRNVSVVMLDLDHFKHFNDTFGHPVGDFLLKEVAAVIQGRVRAGDLACRYGGEEFSLIISEVDAEGAHKCVESIREAIKHLSLHNHGQTLGSVTISAGIAAFPAHGSTPDDLIRAADEALYRAKKAGRDRILIHEQATSESNLADRPA